MVAIRPSAWKKLFARARIFKKFSDYIRWYRLWRTLPVRAWVDGAVSFRDGDFREAARLYEEGLKQCPEHAAADFAQFDLAYCYFRSNLLGKSLATLRNLISSKAQVRDAYLLYAKILLIVGRAASAVGILEKAEAVFPQDPEILAAMMHASLYSSLPAERSAIIKDSLVRAKRALELDDLRNTHLDTALAHYEFFHGDTARGDRVLARVLASGQLSFEAIVLRGERLLALGRYLQAREQLTRAMRVAPEDPRPLLLLAQSYLFSGDDFQPLWAVNLAETACRLSHWQNVQSISVLATAHEANNEEGKAQLFIELMKKLPSLAELNSELYAAAEPAELKVSNS